MTCNPNRTLELSASATDSDGDLTELTGTVEEYDNTAACTQGGDPNKTTTVFSAADLGQNEALGGADTVPCLVGKVYRGTAHAQDAQGAGATGITDCCRCAFADLPDAPVWTILVAAGALLAIGWGIYYWIRRRKLRR